MDKLEAAIKELDARLTALENKTGSGINDADRAVLDRARAFLDKWEPATAPQTSQG